MPDHELPGDPSHPMSGDDARLSRRDLLSTSSVAAAGLMVGCAPIATQKHPESGNRIPGPPPGSAPRTLLVKHATVMVNIDGERREIKDGGLFIENGVIKQVGPTGSLPDMAQEVLDLKGHILLPGLINTHTHLYQHLTRVAPAAQNGNVLNWLKVLYPVWARIRPVEMKLAIQAGLAELALSGCTTVFDHQYIYPNGCTLDDSIEAAASGGLRFHGSRGSMSLGASQWGLPPDSCVEAEPAILRVIKRYHDPKHGVMVQIALAPCSPFSVTPSLIFLRSSWIQSLSQAVSKQIPSRRCFLRHTSAPATQWSIAGRSSWTVSW